MRLGQRESISDVSSISTGSLGLDIALGIGGLPKGRIVEIYGPESSGKTTLAMQAAEALGLDFASVSCTGGMSLSALQGSLQRSFTDALAKHQADTAQSLATINSKIDPLDRSVGSLQENVAQITRKFNDLNKTLDDLSSAIRLLQAPPAPPPAAVPTAAASSAAASTMYEAVYKAYSQGKEDTAMMGFIEYLKQYPQGEDAPSAQYYMGHLFDHASQYEDGVKAFQAVVDRYPDSSRASDAMYMIGVEYQKLKENAKAVAAYQAFLKQNPDHENTSKAKTRIAELRPAVATKNAKKK